MTRRFQIALLVLVAALAGCGRPPKPDGELPLRDPARRQSGPPLIQSARPGPWTAERYAVVIGIDAHDDPKIPRLRFTRNDANAVYAFLTTTGGFKPDNVLLLTSASAMPPTLTNMKRALGEWLVNRAGKDDMVIVYYAGHGAPEIDVTGRERSGSSKYLVPSDADSASLYVTAFPMDEIETVFRRLAAERVGILLDCAFSGAAGGRTFTRQLTRSGAVTKDFLDRLGRGKGRVVISATGPRQLALELPDLAHGLFTHHLLKGLAGAADTDHDGIVTVNEIFGYVHRRVTAHARQLKGEQTPVISGAVGDLPLVRIRD